MTDIKGKWALLTGASRGIGRLSAVFMAKQGVNLVLHSRSREHCQDILNEVKALGVEAYCVEAELSEPEQIEAMCAEIDAKGTPVDIILNNAGLQIAYRTEYLKTPASDYDISFRQRVKKILTVALGKTTAYYQYLAIYGHIEYPLYGLLFGIIYEAAGVHHDGICFRWYPDDFVTAFFQDPCCHLGVIEILGTA